MSTAVSPSSEYAECDEFIDYQIQTARSRIRWTDLLTALLLAGVLLIGYVLIFTICDHWVVTGGFAPGTRAIMLSFVVAVCSVIVYRYVIRPWTREIHPLYAARMLDKSHGEMDGALMSLIDVSSSGTPPTEAIKRAMEKRAAVRLSEVNLDQAIERHWLMRLGGTLFALVVLMCLYVVISPKSINLLRPLSLSNAAVATRTRILKVAPGDAAIPAGTELEIVVDIGGKSPDNVIVMYSTRDQRFVDEQLAMQATEDRGRYRITMLGDVDRGLRQDLTYHIIAGDATSEIFHVSVDQPPTVNVTQLAYSYPDYMVLPDRTTDNGNIEVWEGTKIDLKAEANVPIASARLVFSDDPAFETPAEEVRLKVAGKELFAHFQMDLREDGTSPKFYRIQLEDQEGRTDPAPTVYSVNVRPDQAPIVQLLDPIRDLRVPANAVVSLLARAEDPDFLLRYVKLMIEVNGEPRSPELLFDATRSGLKKSWSGQWEFRLEPLGLQEGDIVRYHLAARDNKGSLGSQSRTGTLQFDIGLPASQEEIDERLQMDREMQDQQRREMEREERLADQAESNDPDAVESRSEADTSDDTVEETTSDGATDNQASDGGTEGGRGAESGTDKEDPASQSKADRGEEGDPGLSEPSETGKEPSSDSQQGDSEGTERNATVSDDEALQKLLERYNEKSAEEQQPNGEDDYSQETSGNSDDAEPSSDSVAAGSDDADPDMPDDQKAFDDASTGIEQKMKPDGGDASPEDGKLPPTTDSEASDAGPDAGTEEGQSPDPTSGDTPSTDTSADTPQDGDDAKPEKDGTGTEQSADGGEGKDPDGAQQSPQDGHEEQSGDPTGTQEEGMTDQQATSSEQGDESQGEDGKQQDGQQDGQQGVQQGKQGGQQGNQGGQDGKQGGQDGKQGGQDGKQGGQDGKQGGQNGKQGGQDGKQGGQDGKQGGQDGKQGGQDGKQGGQDGKQGGQDGKQGGQDGKQGGQDGKQGGQDGKQGGQDGKQGGQDGKQGGQDGKQGDQGGKQGDQGGKQGGQDGGKQGGQQAGGDNQAADSNSGPPGGQVNNSADQSSNANHLSKKAPGAGNVQGGPQDGEPNGGGGGGDGDGMFKSDDPNVQDGAQAASMVLKRLQKELERGQVDKELLEELGWTEDQLKSFSDRIQQQLNSLKDESSDDDMTEKLKRRRVEELLKSLDLTSKSGERVGSRTRDREQQDTTSQRRPAPSRYKDWQKMYQKSLTDGRRR